jgi:hypothetical protein
VEVIDIETQTRIAQFKPKHGPVFEADYIEQTKQLLVTGPHGVIRIVDPHSGKMQQEIQTEVGNHKYDFQKALIAQDGSWLAYANEDNLCGPRQGAATLARYPRPDRNLARLNQNFRVASLFQIDIHIKFIGFPRACREIRHIN